MQIYLTDAFTRLLEDEAWIMGLQARAPIVYIAAGILGMLLFAGFISCAVINFIVLTALIVATVLVIRHIVITGDDSQKDKSTATPNNNLDSTKMKSGAICSE